jgi:hypothetical protein
MVKDTLFKQAWWVSAAVVLAALQIVLAIGIGLDADVTGAERGFFFSVWGAGAALAVLGAQQRLTHRRRGDTLIAVGVVPSVAAGIIAFWFPPMWLITAGGLSVVWSSVRDAVTTVDAVDAAREPTMHP